MKFCKKARYYSRLWSALLRKHKKLIFAGMVIGIACFLLVPRLLSAFSRANRLSLGVVGRYTLATLPREIQLKLSRGLTCLDRSGNPEPNLSKGWEVQDGGKKYLFFLEDNLTWHDGQPVLAKDIRYPFSDVAVSFQGEKTVVFELMEAYSPFPVILSQPVFKEGLIGNGDYKLKTFKERAGYLESISLTPLKKGTPSLVYKFYPNQEAAKTAFKLGEIDRLGEISDPADLGEWPNVSLEETKEENRYAAVFFNVDHPHLGEKNLRQALAYAINKDWPYRCLGPIQPGSWAYNPGVKPYKFDLANAKALFAKSQEEREESDRLKSLELSTLASLLTDAEKIKQDWEGLGINVKVRVVNSLEENFEALLLYQESPADPDQYSLWHSTRTTNLTHYSNPKIDVLLEEGRKTTDQEERKEIYLDFQRFVVEESPAIFLFHPTLYTITRK